MTMINANEVAIADKAQVSSLTLARALAAYLPEAMVAQLLLPELPGQTAFDRLQQPRTFEAVTMLVDITGFTPLCEALAKKGHEGAEQVTELINGFFGRALKLVQQQGGVIAKFGGDAFNAFFRCQPGENWDNTLQRALYTAFALQTLILDYKGLRLPGDENGNTLVFELSAKVGLGAGAITVFSVGEPGKHCDFQLVGAPFNQAAEAEHHAQRGEVLGHQEFLKQAACLLPCIELGEQRGACHQILAYNGVLVAPVQPLFNLTALEAGWLASFIKVAAAFVPKSIFERLKLGYNALPGEHRRVVSLFVNFTGFAWQQDSQAAANFQRYYLAVVDEVQRYGGNLNRISSGDKGDLLHIIFGAPISHQDDVTRALHCGLALQALSRNFEFITWQKIGLSCGFAFAGEIGSPERHEYTVIGDAVNLSARLMQMATPWSILLDVETTLQLAGQFEFAPPRAVQLKGKRGFIQVCEVLQTRLNLAEVQNTAFSPGLLPIYGRETELAQAASLRVAAIHGEPKILAITGEPGIGKSYLLGQIGREWQATRGQVCSVSIQPYEHSAFKLWVNWLTALFQLDNQAALAVRQAQYQALIAQLAPPLQEWAPLWGELLDLQIPEPPWLQSLDRATRYRQLVHLTPQLLQMFAMRQPLLMICDDLQWADSASLGLLDEVIPAIKTGLVLFCLAGRTAEMPNLQLLKAETVTELALPALAPGASQELILAALGQSAISSAEHERFSTAVYEMTGGNPFFIEELLNALRAENMLETAIKGGGLSAPLSYSLQGLIMARLDALDNRLREVIMTASVAGNQFSAEMVKLLLPISVAETLDGSPASPLYQLQQLDLLRVENMLYRFRHSLIQQVAYAVLPFARRRFLHEEVAHYFEQEVASTVGDTLERLTYHYGRSDNHAKAVLYLAQSGERAARLTAYQEALQQYRSALERAERSAATITPAAPELLLRLGDVQAELNDFEAALNSYTRALAKTEASFERARLEQRQAAVLQRATRYDEALAAIGQAETTLSLLSAMPLDRQLKKSVKLVQAELAVLYSTIFLRQSKYALARQWAENGLNLLTGAVGRETEGAIVKVKLNEALAAALAMLKQMPAAQQALSKALRLSQQRQDLLTEAQLQARLAILAMQREQLGQAQVFFQRALPLIEKTQVADRLAHLLLPGGQTFLYRGEFAEARRWLERGLALANTPFLRCSGHYLLGWVDKEVGSWPQALEHCVQSAMIAEKHGLWDRYIEFLARQGELLAFQGHYQAAEEKLQQAINYATERKLPVVALCYRFLAEIYYNQGLFEAAADCLQRVGLAIPGEPTVATAFVSLRLAEWWALQSLNGTPGVELITAKEIEQRSQLALNFFRARNFKLYLATARRINGLVAWAQGHTHEAAQHFNAGLKQARTIGQMPETARLLACRSRFRLASAANNPLSAVQADLDSAIRLFAHLGATLELKQVEQLRTQITS